MKVKPLGTPLKGEHIVGVHPTMKPQDVQAGWLKRLNLFTGRTLTETALGIEQQHRAGRIAMRGQMRSSGVTSGLNVGLEIRAKGTPEEKRYLRINSGMGVTIHGEEVVVPKELRIDTEDLKPQARSAGILVLEPISIEEIGRFNQEEGVQSDFTERFFSDDPCELDSNNDAFEDWQWVDGLQVKLFPWPSEWRPQPAFGNNVQWWNRLVYTIFEAERERKLDEFFPWEEVGVPIALIGFNSNSKAIFVDHSAVVRAGGRSRSRTPWMPGMGNRFLWRARIDQLSEQLSDPLFSGKSIDELAKRFRYLPPTGFLPKEAIDARTGKSHFFPANYQVDAVPIPFEQLNVAMQASASLSPYDLFTTDQVRFLIPIPQPWYEPDLLQVESVNAAFQETIDRFIGVRAEWLQRREDVRAKTSALHNASTGKPLEFPLPDPEAADIEEVGSGVLNPPEKEYGTDKLDGKLTIIAINQLKEGLAQHPLTQQEIDQLDNVGVEEFIRFLEEKINCADDKIDFGFLRVQTDIYRIRQVMLGSDIASRLATDTTLAEIAKGASAVATREDLETFFKGVKRETQPEGEAEAGQPQENEIAGAAFGIFNRAAGVFPTAAEELRIVKEAPLGQGFQGFRFGNQRTTNVFQQIKVDPLANIFQKETTIKPLKFFNPGTPPTKEDIVGKAPIVGKAVNFRTVTIADRIQESPAVEAKNFAVATKYGVLKDLTELCHSLNFEDLEVPGFLKYQADGKSVETQRVVVDTNNVTKTKEVPIELHLSFKEIQDQNLAEEILKDKHDLDPINGDESAFFAAGVRALNHTSAILRVVEGRIAGYKKAVLLCRETLTSLKSVKREITSRLNVINDTLNEARHDVTVTRALLAEETARVKAINDRRDQIVDRYVQVVAYQRPRHGETILPVPERILDPGLAEPPVPACLRTNLTPSAELEEMLDLLRESPVKWFPAVNLLLNRFKQLPIFYEIFQSAQLRQTNKFQKIPQAIKQGSSEGRIFGQSIGRVYSAQQKVASQQAGIVKQFDLNLLSGKSWKWVRNKAKDIVSLGDLIEGSHRNSVVVGAASDELKHISKVAACLHVGFSEVLPVIRLGWAERLSQHDEPVNLRNLASLPQWHEIDRLDRQELQTLIDWLYRRIDIEISEAVDFMNDLVRVIILLASHAPVDQIIGGRLPAPVKINPGILIDVTAFDLSKVNVGMHVFMYGKGTAANQPAISARGVVEDIGPTGIATRILEAASPSLELEENTRIQFSNSNAFNITFSK